MKYPLTFTGNPNRPEPYRCSFCESNTGSDFITLNGGSLQSSGVFLSVTSHHRDYVGIPVVSETELEQYEFYFCDTACMRGFLNAIVDDVECRHTKIESDYQSLNSVCGLLGGQFAAEIRGEHSAKYVYAESDAGSIEFSCNAEDSYWVEYYRPDSSVSVKERTLYSESNAIDSIIEWLK